MTKGCPREWLFGNVVITKVMGEDEISYFKLFPDVQDHLGEVQPLRQPGVGHSPRGVPRNDFLAMLFKQKLLGMKKMVV